VLKQSGVFAEVIEEALADLRVSGSVLLHEGYAAAFSVEIPDEVELRRLLRVDARVRVLPFHFVWKGNLQLSGAAPRPLAVRERDVAICLSGKKHRIASGRGVAPVGLESLLNHATERSARSVAASVECICGCFLVQALPLNPLLTSLPAVLQLSTTDSPRGPLLAHAAEMLAFELAQGRRQGFTVSRLLEIFCAEAIYGYPRTTDLPSWLRGVADPRIGPAIARVHAQPAEPWTVAAMAAIVSMSPSRFAAHFRETTRTTAMAYVTQWRMHVACRALTSTQAGIAQVASEVGYGDVAAFSRAFKALVGQSPARWRNLQAGNSSP
jgi:AraC-like DNA-binding protein